MTCEIALREVASKPIAAVRRRTRRAELGKTIMGGLDAVYAVLRARGAAGLGHNVVVYRSATGWGPDDVLEIEVGVETSAPIEPEGDVQALATPGGRAATATHVGAYDGLPATNQAVRRWMLDHGLTPGLDWEVYGDWSDDPARLTTEVFFLVRESRA